MDQVDRIAELSKQRSMFMKLRRARRSLSHLALLTPYDGGNLGDAAIQEALINNLRKHDPQIRFSGITLHPEVTSSRHNIPCYPLAALSRPHYQAKKGPAVNFEASSNNVYGEKTIAKRSWFSRVRQSLRALIFGTGLRPVVRLIQEGLHIVRSYAFLWRMDMLVIAGGGQLDDEWGGSWGHPYALMKWAILARATGMSVVFLSVGACRMDSRLTRFFLRMALSLACYRTYRDHGSRQLALALTRRADGSVVPDLAFSLSHTNECTVAPAGADLQVGVSPIAYGHPGLWPTEDRARYEYYIDRLASFVTSLLEAGISVTLFSSASPDEQIIDDLRARIDSGLQSEARRRLSSCSLASVDDLLRLVCRMDIVVSSRLHGLILSFLAKKPAVALSYDRKVETLMAELGQEAYCLDIRSFDKEDLLAAFQSLQSNNSLIASQLNSICPGYDRLLQRQYRLVTQLLARGVRSSRQARTLVASEKGLYQASTDAGPLA